MKKIQWILSTSLLITTIFVTTSCGSNKENVWDTNLSFAFKTPWETIAPNDLLQFESNWAQEINNLKNKDDKLKKHLDVNVSVDISFSKDAILVQDVVSRKKDMAISSIYSINNDARRDDIYPILQTRTTMFKFDKEYSVYKDGTPSDPLRKIAKQTNNIFMKKSFHHLLDDLKDGWTGSRYNKFYEIDKTVDFYRGAIWIWGNSKTISKINDAWTNKNFEVFRNFGILHGQKNSGGKWQLQKALLQKHFNNFFNGTNSTTLEEDSIKHSNKYKIGDAKAIATDDFHILFDDEGSFAWTHALPSSNYFKLKEPSSIVQVLIVTDPLKYDIGYFRKNMAKKQAQIIVQALMNIQNKNEDIYGPKYGYNKYSLINDQDIENEVYKKYEQAING